VTHRRNSSAGTFIGYRGKQKSKKRKVVEKGGAGEVEDRSAEAEVYERKEVSLQLSARYVEEL
jgi:hypothetical protein